MSRYIRYSAALTAAILTTSPLAGAQDRDPDRDPMGDRNEPQRSAQAREATHSGFWVVPADELQGTPVEGRNGERLGEVQDVVVETSHGKIAAAIISVEDGDERVVPWDALRKSRHGTEGAKASMHEEKKKKMDEGNKTEDEQARGSGEHMGSRESKSDSECRLVLNATAEELRGAPAWNERTLSKGLVERAEQHFERQRSEESSHAGRMGADGGTDRRDAGSARNELNRARAFVVCSKLQGTEVSGQKDDGIGEIDQVLLDLGDARTACLVVGVGGALGLGERAVPVPWKAMNVSSDAEQDGEIRVSLPMDEQRLESAPELPDEKTRGSSYAWLDRSFQFFAQEPYWEGASARPASFEREGERGSMEKERLDSR